ncbi:MAG: histidine kinase [Chitinophagales bacterium]|nr:histidine kinase [Chitinophagales bacterium]
MAQRRSFKDYEPLLHVIFWIGYIILLNSVYAGLEVNGWLIFLSSLCTTAIHAFLVYFNLWYLIPKFYNRERYLLFYGIIVLVVFAILPIRVVLDNWLLGGGEKIMTHLYTFSYLGNTLLSLVVMVFVSGSWRANEQWHYTQRLKHEIKNYRLEAEMRLLRSQVNPHFLFNALNNIYALTFTNAQQAAPAILQLSGMMRYMLESSRLENVSLDKEIQYIYHYIEMQQLKKAQRQNIRFEIHGLTAGIMVEPMLFMPFFENSFKHGNIETYADAWIRSALEVTNEGITFKIENSTDPNAKKRHHDQENGTGIENVQQRLALRYGDAYTLDIDDHPYIFSVRLKLPLSV